MLNKNELLNNQGIFEWTAPSGEAFMPSSRNPQGKHELPKRIQDLADCVDEIEDASDFAISVVSISGVPGIMLDSCYDESELAAMLGAPTAKNEQSPLRVATSSVLLHRAAAVEKDNAFDGCTAVVGTSELGVFVPEELCYCVDEIADAFSKHLAKNSPVDEAEMKRLYLYVANKA